MADEFYSFRQENKVSLPTAPLSFVIDKREWERLKKVVDKCKPDEKWFKSIAFCFYGISGSAFITWYSLLSQEDIETTRLVLLIVAIVTLVLGCLCIGVQYHFDKSQGLSIQAIKEELHYIEEGICPEEVK